MTDYENRHANLAIDWVQAEIEKAAGAAGLCARTQLRRGVSTRALDEDGPGSSPLEIAFYAWWKALDSGSVFPFTLRPQLPVNANGRNYRLDFAVTSRGSKVAIELDGHDFHERTPEQVTARDSRDRDLQQEGWKVFHFSGRELRADPLRAVASVYQYVLTAFFAAEGTEGPSRDDAESMVRSLLSDMGF